MSCSMLAYNLQMHVNMVFVVLFVLGLLLLNAEGQACPQKCHNELSRLGKRIKSLEIKIVSLESSEGGGGSSGSGAVYTRWGRTTCPENNELLFDGFAAGSHYTHPGGGANHLCLPKEPQFANVADGAQHCGGLIYGTEYEICPKLKDIFQYDNANSDTIQDHDVPCAVCQASNRQSQIFLPARTECPQGWVQEYQGYVMGGYHARPRTEWVCVDLAPETRPNGNVNRNGALFYLVEAKCGSLPCPPYKDGNELACVVCTK